MSKKTKLAILGVVYAVCVFSVFIVVGGAHVSALVNLNPNPSGRIPTGNYNYLRGADSQAYSPAFTSWVSPAGNPAVTSVTVPRGSGSVSLRFHRAGAVGFPIANPIVLHAYRVTNATVNNGASISGAIGVQQGFDFNPTPNRPGTYRSQSFAFTLNAPAGGFTTTRNYLVSIYSPSVNQFQGGQYLCVDNRAPTTFFSWPTDCNSVLVAQAVITVVVPPPPPPPPPANWDARAYVSNCDANSSKITFGVNRVAGNVTSNITGTLTVNLNNPGGTYSQNYTVTAAELNASGSREFEYILNPPLQLGQSFSATFSISPGGAGSSGTSTTGSSNNSASCSDSGPKRSKPYMRVYGSETVVGLPFHQGGVCSGAKDVSSSGPGIETYSDVNSSGSRIGSGSQFAVSAAGKINDFISSSLHQNGPPGSNPDSGVVTSIANNNGSFLSFNSTGNDNKAYTGCIDDYETYINNNPDKAKAFTTNRIQSGANYSSNKISYYNGDLEIETDIGTGDDKLDRLTSDVGTVFIVVKGGNINIHPNVQTINSVLIALPDGAGNKGEINTCYDNGIQVLRCDSILRVNGALIAKKVHFNRFKGSIDASLPNNETADDPDGTIAEIINFPAHLYLRLAENTPQTGVGTKGKYDAIQGLPPVL